MTTHVLPPTPPPPSGFTVTSATGQQLSTLNQEEVNWYERTKGKYLAENRFTEVTDLQDLDSLLTMELIVHRWTQWTMSGRDYDGHLISEGVYTKPLREYAVAIGTLKTRMGLARAEREREQHESVGAYLIELQRRAKEFGIHRETQLGKAIELTNQLSALIGAYDRADEEEREAIGITSDNDILDWIRQTLLPEFRLIDDHFRAHQQRFWAGTL